MEKKNKRVKTGRIVLELILLVAFILAGLEIFHNLGKEKKTSTQPNQASRETPVYEKDSTIPHTPGDSSLWDQTEFMD
ncbi:MAG TPA: hypothetical protein VJ876_04555 [Bacteroidales bacterium]|nr:hypothetical protein [Bacteroidales bacterium]